MYVKRSSYEKDLVCKSQYAIIELVVLMCFVLALKTSDCGF